MDSYILYFVGVLFFVFLVGLTMAVLTKPSSKTPI